MADLWGALDQGASCPGHNAFLKGRPNSADRVVDPVEQFFLLKVGRSANIDNTDTTNKTIATTSSQTIDGVTIYTLPPGAAVEVISDGSNWRIF